LLLKTFFHKSSGKRVGTGKKTTGKFGYGYRLTGTGGYG